MYIQKRKVIKSKFPRCHYTRKKHSWKAKIPYDSFDAALISIKRNNMFNYYPYKCKMCNKWHIGYKKQCNDKKS